MLFEGTHAEFRRRHTDRIAIAVMAFANTEGGKPYVGTEDDGTVCGAENPDMAIRQVSDLIRHTIHPDLTLHTTCGTQETDGKTVAVVTVEQGLDRRNCTHAEIGGLCRVERRDCPDGVLREALFNALIHRDHTVRGSIMIGMYDDRIVFIPYGSPAGGLLFEDLLTGGARSAIRGRRIFFSGWILWKCS